MKRAACIILTALSVLLLQGAAPAQAAPAAGTPASGGRGRPKYKADELLVRFRVGASGKDVQAAHGRVQAQVARSYHIVPNLQLVRLPHGANLMQVARAYRKDKAVLYAEPNYQVHALVTPNDPQFTNGTQWDLNNTGQAPTNISIMITADLSYETKPYDIPPGEHKDFVIPIAGKIFKCPIDNWQKFAFAISRPQAVTRIGLMVNAKAQQLFVGRVRLVAE